MLLVYIITIFVVKLAEKYDLSLILHLPFRKNGENLNLQNRKKTFLSLLRLYPQVLRYRREHPLTTH